jgi:hypothetical protein
MIVPSNLRNNTITLPTLASVDGDDRIEPCGVIVNMVDRSCNVEERECRWRSESVVSAFKFVIWLHKWYTQTNQKWLHAWHPRETIQKNSSFAV